MRKATRRTEREQHDPALRRSLGDLAAELLVDNPPEAIEPAVEVLTPEKAAGIELELEVAQALEADRILVAGRVAGALERFLDEWTTSEDGSGPAKGGRFSFENRRALRERASAVLARLEMRERRVLTVRYGLEDGRPRTITQAAKELGLARERARQIEAAALGKLRSHSTLTAEAAAAKQEAAAVDGILAKVLQDDPMWRFLKAIWGEPSYDPAQAPSDPAFTSRASSRSPDEQPDDTAELASLLTGRDERLLGNEDFVNPFLSGEASSPDARHVLDIRSDD